MRKVFARLDQKCKLMGNFEKTLKIFDENSIEKLNFYFIFILNFILNFTFRKFVTQNRAIGNKTHVNNCHVHVAACLTLMFPAHLIGKNCSLFRFLPQLTPSYSLSLSLYIIRWYTSNPHTLLYS